MAAEDLAQNKILICPEKIHAAKENTLTKTLVSSKYESLLNSDTWGYDVLPELNNSSQIVDSNIRETYCLYIQNDNTLEHSFVIKN